MTKFQYDEVVYPDSSFVSTIYRGVGDSAGKLLWVLNKSDYGYAYPYGSDADKTFSKIVNGESAGRLFHVRPSSKEYVDLEEIQRIAETPAETPAEKPEAVSIRDWLNTLDGLFGNKLREAFDIVKEDTNIVKEDTDDELAGVTVVQQYDLDGNLTVSYEISNDAKFVLVNTKDGLETIFQ